MALSKSNRGQGRIGVVGTFDTDAFGDALVPQIFRREIATRLPSVKITTFSPYGSLRPAARDSGEPAEPLGRWDPERATALWGGLDLVIVAGADLLADADRLAAAYGVSPTAIQEVNPHRWFVGSVGEDGERRCPMVWSAVTVGRDPTAAEGQLLAVATHGWHVSAGDTATSRRLAAAGFEGEIDLVPDPLVLVPRLFSPDLLAKRLEYLWLMRWYPAEGAAVLVEGDSTLLPAVPALATALTSLLASGPDLRIVLAEMGAPGGTEFADALTAALPAESVYRLPGYVGLEDLAAAIAHCAAFAGNSQRAGMVALAYGHRCILLDPVNPPTLETFRQALKASPPAGEAATLAARVDAELDLIARIVREAVGTHPSGEAPMPDTDQLEEMQATLEDLRVAHEARSRRLATERMVFANHLHKAEAEIGRLKDETARLREELAQALSRVSRAEEATRAEAAARAAVEEELAALRATRTFRYTAELRNVYGRLRRISDAAEMTPEP